MFSKQAYDRAVIIGLSRAIFDRTDFVGGFPEPESLHTAINGVLQGATDEQRADIYSQLVEKKFTRDSGKSFITLTDEILNRAGLL